MSENSTQLQHDALFASPLGEVAEFRFDQSVVNVFPDMLKRSVPGYRSIITQSGLLAARFVRPNTRLYDLGSSLGATTLAMHRALMQQENKASQSLINGCEIHAIDNSTAMVETAAEVIQNETGHAAIVEDGSLTENNPLPIYLHCQNMQSSTLSNASVVAMNFTLQFINPAEREALIQKIANALLPGGVLILSEKVKFDDPVLNELHIDMYHNYKRANGYSDLEISQKRTALENVLVPDTLDTHHTRLIKAGFETSSVWFQCFNFASIVAIKRGQT